MSLDEKEFLKLTKLCRIECSPEEKEKLLSNISKILSYVSLLEELGTQDEEPCYQVLDSVNNILRQDEVGETLPADVFLSNAPHIGGMIKLPPILKTST